MLKAIHDQMKEKFARNSAAAVVAKALASESDLLALADLADRICNNNGWRVRESRHQAENLTDLVYRDGSYLVITEGGWVLLAALGIRWGEPLRPRAACAATRKV